MTLVITPDQNLPKPPVSGDVFSTPPFRSIIAHEFKLKAVQVHMQVDGQTVLIPAFMRRTLWGKKTLILGAGFDKTGVIPAIAASAYSKIIGQLAQELGATGISALEIRTTQHIPYLTDESDKVELNIDIHTSAEAIWNGLSTNTRKNIRRPLKQGFTAVVGKTPALLDEFYQLYCMSLHDIGSLPHPLQFFTDLLAQCPEHLEIFVGYMDGIPVVSSVNFTHADEIYGAWSGIHGAYKKHNVFIAMLWKMLEHCENSGRKTYNLGRSSEGSNPYLFKRKLANRTHKIYYYMIKISAQRKTQSRIHDAASWLIRHTPEAVMHGLSRALIHKFY